MRLIEKRTGGIQRYLVTSHRMSSLHIVRYDKMIRSGPHQVRIVDVSIVGMGIESCDRIEQGLVCFEETVSGHRLGMVNWCRPLKNAYRAGISFLTLPHEKERYILHQVKESTSPKPLTDPERIIEELLKNIKRDTASQIAASERSSPSSQPGFSQSS